MIESPDWKKWQAEALQAAILTFLKARFGAVPHDVSKRLRKIFDEKDLNALIITAAKCSDMDTFHDAILSRTS